MKRWTKLGPVAGVAAAHDLIQRRHAILRTFPVLGHARFWLEGVGPELRQYVVAGNDEERPFSRDQRRWVYASAKLENKYFGFGTDNDLEHSAGNAIVHHRTFGRMVATHGVPGSAWQSSRASPKHTTETSLSARARPAAFAPRCNCPPHRTPAADIAAPSGNADAAPELSDFVLRFVTRCPMSVRGG